MNGVVLTGTTIDQCIEESISSLPNLHAGDISKMLKDVFPARPGHRLSTGIKNQKEQGICSLIAEIKRGSPSFGVLHDHADIVSVAKVYTTSGATALSVLTQPKFFLGSFDDLRLVALSVTLPVLCKDFIVHAAQVYHARRCGAAAVLLIAMILDDHLLKSLIELSHELGMDALVEVHTALEVTKAVRCGAKMIGVNARDLKTLTVDLSVCTRLLPMIPSHILKVAESGIQTYSDVEMIRLAGADAMLVGTSLMQQNDAGEKIRELLHGPDI